MTGPRSRFRTFVGIALGGGRGKQTAVARLAWQPGAPAPDLAVTFAAARVGHRGTGEAGAEPASEAGYLRDPDLEAYLDLQLADDPLVAVDAPVTVPPCLRCRLSCPGIVACPQPDTRLVADLAPRRGSKPVFLPYAERACEVVHRLDGSLVRAGFGQGTAPVAARVQYLLHRFAGRLVPQVNLVEVAPRAALVRWYGEATERATRVGAARDVQRARAEVLEDLRGRLRFERVWPELVVRQRAVFYAVVAAVLASDLAREGWTYAQTVADPELARVVDEHADVFVRAGWIWLPPPGRPAA